MVDPAAAARILPLPAPENCYVDNENDLQLLLHWLEPFFPGQFHEPSPRVRLAIRSCLKNNTQHLALLNLYTSRILAQFRAHSFENYLFLYMIKSLHLIDQYYQQHLHHLNFNSHCSNLFTRRLHALYHLLVANQLFVTATTRYFLAALSADTFSDEAKHCITVLTTCGFSELVISSIVQSLMAKIQSHIQSTCAGVWDEPCLPALTSWISTELYPIFSTIANNNDHLSDLATIAQDELVLLRTLEIFEIVKNRKKVALEELHRCLQNQSLPLQLDEQRDCLVQTFSTQCQERLLHSGVDTVTVISMYASTIKSFLLVDPRGVLLDKVVRQIRRYLKSRSDVISKIVKGLLADENDHDNPLSELARELRQIQIKPIVEEPELHWVPDPIDALPDFKKGKVSDIVELLILIFELKAIFTNEFTEHFGKKLLLLADYDVSEIALSVDLLRLKFGDLEFTTLDIMLRDIVESKKVNDSLIHAPNLSNHVYHSKILSHLYWSMLPDEDDKLLELQIPKLIANQGVEFTKAFAKTTQGRELKIIPQLGIVKLELEFPNTRLYFEVLPLEASIIGLFSEHLDSLSIFLTADQIKDRLGVKDSYEVNQGIASWVLRSVLIKDQDRGTYLAVLMPPLQVSDDELVKLYRYKELDQVWPFVESMLKNLAPLPAEKIELFLNVTLPKDLKLRFSYDDAAIKGYLEWCVDRGRLIIRNGEFELNGNNS